MLYEEEDEDDDNEMAKCAKWIKLTIAFKRFHLVCSQTLVWLTVVDCLFVFKVLCELNSSQISQMEDPNQLVC